MRIRAKYPCPRKVAIDPHGEPCSEHTRVRCKRREGMAAMVRVRGHDRSASEALYQPIRPMSASRSRRCLSGFAARGM
jgi:hypothetical protein